MERTLPGNARTIEWLNRLIALAQWDWHLPLYFARLVIEPAKYQEALRLIRLGINNAEAARQVPPCPAADVLSNDEWKRLYEKVTTAPPLREIFGADQDPFDGAPPDQLLLLAEVSDITTDPRTMVYSRNGTFLAVWEIVRQSPDLSQLPDLNSDHKQIWDGLNKFFTLFDTDADTAEMLYKLACSNDWYVVLASLRDGRDYTQDEAEAVKETLKKWNQTLTAILRGLLFDPTQVSRVPKKLIKLAWEKRLLFDQARAAIPADRRPKGLVEERKQVTYVVLENLVQQEKTTIDNIESDIRLLAGVAKHYLEVRKFAKLDGFVYGWPKIAELAMANYRSLQELEEPLIRETRPAAGEFKTKGARELFDMSAGNRDLIRFLALQPYFREINENDLRRYRPLAPVTLSVITQSTAPSGSVLQEVQTDRPSAPSLSRQPSRVCQLTISKISSEPIKKGEEKLTYEVTMVVLDKKLRAPITFSIQSLLSKMLMAIGASSEDSLQPVLKSLAAGSTISQQALLVRAGSILRDEILGDFPLQKELVELFNGEQPARLVIVSTDPELQYLPWEWLPRPNRSELVLSNSRFSIVRTPNDRKEAITEPLKTPVGLLSVLPSPPPMIRLNLQSSGKALETMASSERVDYHPLSGEQATLENVEIGLQSFRPRIVHFEGYVQFSAEKTPHEDAFQLFLASPRQDYEGIDLKEFAQILTKNGVQLLVIGQNGIGKVFGNAGPAMGTSLVKLGVPAVLVPVRAIDDATATAFTTEFYHAFLRGNSLEDAIFTARHTVESKGGDWSAFALFANPSVLDFFQLLPGVA